MLAGNRQICDYGGVRQAFVARSDFFGMETAIPASKPPQTPIESLTFEAALKELETIVGKLEQGAVDLEDSIALYERGQSLKTHCEAKLKAAEGRLEKIVMGTNGPQLAGMADP